MKKQTKIIFAIYLIAVLILTYLFLVKGLHNVHAVEGSFYGEIEMINNHTLEKETWYQFQSDDNAIWWRLSREEIGHIPDNKTKYILIYNDNGTTAENKPCNCASYIDCECELYDDKFIHIKEVK